LSSAGKKSPPNYDETKSKEVKKKKYERKKNAS